MIKKIKALFGDKEKITKPLVTLDSEDFEGLKRAHKLAREAAIRRAEADGHLDELMENVLAKLGN